MFSNTNSRPRISSSGNAVPSNMDQGLPYGYLAREMGPPAPSFPPRPVEMDPSYRRPSGPYPHWETMTGPSSTSTGESVYPFVHAMGGPRTMQPPVDFSSQSNPQDYPLASWYRDNDGPWIPKGAVPEIPPVDGLLQKPSSVDFRGNGYFPQSGQVYRTPIPSENGSMPHGKPYPDSGYGSSRSLENASVRSYDAALHSGMGRRSHPSQNSEWHRISGTSVPSPYEAATPSRSSIVTKGSVLNCSTCHKTVKTRSELKKHDLRHRKPFTCPHAGCSRTAQGFSTTNDLDRHMRSRHPEDPLVGNSAKTYHCLVEGCKSKAKTWPRLDNFRSHLKRVHGMQGDDLDDFVRRTIGQQLGTTPNFLPKTELLSMGSHGEDLQTMTSADSLDTNDSASLQGRNTTSSSLKDQSSSFVQDEVLIGSKEAVGPNSTGRTPETSFNMLTVPEVDQEASMKGCLGKRPTHTSLLTDVGTTADNPPIPQATVGTAAGVLPRRGIQSTKLKASPETVALREAISVALAKTGGSTPGSCDSGDQDSPNGNLSESLGSSPSNATPSDSSTLFSEDHDFKLPIDSDKIAKLLRAFQQVGFELRESESLHNDRLQVKRRSAVFSPGKKGNNVDCEICHKFNGRPCELRKHMKRHDRPYGCTFFKCKKTFGSKNDWKRHELSQHYQPETWRCEQQNEGIHCVHVSLHLETFKKHLASVHHIKEQNIGEHVAHASHIGPNFQKSFWCGFCCKSVALDQKGVEAWSERFDHIDDHFMGRRDGGKRSILEWKTENDGTPGASVLRAKLGTECGSGESSEAELESSSTDSSASNSPENLSPSSQAESSAAPRKRHSNSHDDDRPSKKVKREERIFCCQCDLHFNPKTDTECALDNHRFCDECVRRYIDKE